MAYIQLPAFKANAMVNFSGLNSGIDALGQRIKEDRVTAKNQEVGNAMAEARYGDAANTAFRQGDLSTGIGIKKHQTDMAGNSRKEEEAYAQRVGQYFQNFIEPERDPTKRQGLVSAWIGSHPEIGSKLTENGIDPNNVDQVIRFVRAEATPFMTPKEEADLARIQAGTAAEQARARHYDTMGNKNGKGGDLRNNLRGITSPEEWNSPRIQSIIQTAFGGPVPWEKRGEVLSAADTSGGPGPAMGDPFLPTSEEAELGITREMKIKAARNQKLQGMFGEVPKGYSYDIENGEPTALPNTEKRDEINKKKGILDFHLSTLAEAEKVMKDSNWAERAIGIGGDVGEVGQAAADWENSVLGLVYERSGKQTAVAEMRQWLATYGPKAGDGRARVDKKLQRVREFYTALTGEEFPDAAPRDNRPDDPNKARLKSKYGLE